MDLTLKNSSIESLKRVFSLKEVLSEGYNLVEYRFNQSDDPVYIPICQFPESFEGKIYVYDITRTTSAQYLFDIFCAGNTMGSHCNRLTDEQMIPSGDFGVKLVYLRMHSTC